MNVEHSGNSLVLDLDNWIYSLYHTYRYRLIDGKWEREAMPQRGREAHEERRRGGEGEPPSLVHALLGEAVWALAPAFIAPLFSLLQGLTGKDSDARTTS